MDNAPTIEAEGLSTKEIFLYTAGTIVLAGGSIWLFIHLMQKAGERRVEKKASDETTPEAYAKSLKMAFENDGYWGTNMQEVRRIFQQIPDKGFLEKVKAKYKERYHRPLMSDLSDELQSTEYNEVMSIIAGKPDKRLSDGSKPVYNYLAWAKRLKAAFDKSYGIFPGTDEPAIKAVFVEIPTQSAFLSVADFYQRTFYTNLIEDLKSELEVWEYPSYMGIITSKPKN